MVSLFTVIGSGKYRMVYETWLANPGAGCADFGYRGQRSDSHLLRPEAELRIEANLAPFQIPRSQMRNVEIPNPVRSDESIKRRKYGAAKSGGVHFSSIRAVRHQRP